MSYKTMRRMLHELSLEQLTRMRNALLQSQKSTRSPARLVKIDAQLECVGHAIDRACEIAERDEAWDRICA